MPPIYNPPKSGGGNAVQGTVDFGFPTGKEGDVATVTVAATWVTSSSIIVCSVSAETTADHSPDDPLVEGLVAYAGNIVNGVGFDIVCVAPNNSWGRYVINAVGV